ncbi:hypothetical protein HK100_004111 [Physocladia obscura]|uniref:Uncharacterized protein n=1 Tax=Physocladia obscura TaxID=109957 RepID=A0AAD5SZ33_9FUNG|nr:hypothetical protein HK100_004111 [Physocladia obscura]
MTELQAAKLYSTNGSQNPGQLVHEAASSFVPPNKDGDIISISSSPVAHPCSPEPTKREATPPQTTSCSPASSSSSLSNNIAFVKKDLKQQQALQIAIVLKKRLSYAAFKVKHGWQNEAIESVLKLTDEKYDKIPPTEKQKAASALVASNGGGNIDVSGRIIGVAIKRLISDELISAGQGNDDHGVNSQSSSNHIKKIRSTSADESSESTRVIETRRKARPRTLTEDVAIDASIKILQEKSPQINPDQLLGMAASRTSLSATSSTTTTSITTKPADTNPAAPTPPTITKPILNSINTGVPNHIPISNPYPKTTLSQPSRDQPYQYPPRSTYPQTYPSTPVQPQYPSYSPAYPSYAYAPPSSTNRAHPISNTTQNYSTTTYPYQQQQLPQHARYPSANASSQPQYPQYQQSQTPYRPLDYSYNAPYAGGYARPLPHSSGYDVANSNAFGAGGGRIFSDTQQQQQQQQQQHHQQQDPYRASRGPPYPGNQWPHN